MDARIEMYPVRDGGGTYVPKLRTRDGDLIDNGGVVVITNGMDAGGIGVLAIQPSRETATVMLGNTHVNVVLDEIRPLKMGEKVAKP